MIFIKDKQMKVANLQMDEILQSINDAADVEKELRANITMPFLRPYLLVLLSEEWPEFDVDEIKWTNYDYHRSMAGAILLSKPTWNIFSKILMNKNVNKHTQQYQCKALLEMLHCSEARVLVAIL